LDLGEKMFETAEVGGALSDEAFREVRGDLRLDLVDLQQKCRAADFPVITILMGVKGAGILDTVNLLNTWMDPRWIATTTFDDPTDEEMERPVFWRYWRSLPKAGAIGLYPGGWYMDPIFQHCTGKLSRAQLDESILSIKSFERTLAEEGAMILKFWLHLSKPEQRKLLGRHTNKDPVVGLRATDSAWQAPKDYDRYLEAAGYTIRQTMDAKAPWFIVEGVDDNFRRATVLMTLRDNLKHHIRTRRRLIKQRAKDIEREAKDALRLIDKKPKAKSSGNKKKKGKSAEAAVTSGHAPVRRVLDTIDMEAKVSAADYAPAFHRAQVRLHKAQQKARKAGLSSVIAFEGWDAAGKGGAIRRLTFALDSRDYRIVPIAAPSDEERAHHYLWRFWRHLGRAGRMTIFDRTWYGRVLVERVEHLITEEDCLRAYSEINDFEEQLASNGTIVIKFFLHLSDEEQLGRFNKRKDTPYRRWKLTDEDWRNRENRPQYEEAINDMVSRTSTSIAPWHLVSADDKKHTRLTVLEIVSGEIEKALRKLRENR
jgi:AMP-polyphosphate phosphotransferase